MPYAVALGGWASLAALVVAAALFCLSGLLIVKNFDKVPAGMPHTYPALGARPACLQTHGLRRTCMSRAALPLLHVHQQKPDCVHRGAEFPAFLLDRTCADVFVLQRGDCWIEQVSVDRHGVGFMVMCDIPMGHAGVSALHCPGHMLRKQAHVVAAWVVHMTHVPRRRVCAGPAGEVCGGRLHRGGVLRRVLHHAGHSLEGD